MSNKTIIINLISGPGCGKSTTSAQLFYELKKRHINVEITNEYAKGLTYEENYKKIKNQLYLFAKQQNQIYRLNGIVDIIIMDSPLILSAIYDLNKSEELKNLIMYEHNKLKNLTYFLERETEYKSEGRYHNLDEAIEVDTKILSFMDEYKVEYKKVRISNIINTILNDLSQYDKFSGQLQKL